jgi:hypothetical protein
MLRKQQIGFICETKILKNHIEPNKKPGVIALRKIEALFSNLIG